MQDLFSNTNDSTPMRPREKSLSQYLTPPWASSLLVEQFFPELSATSFVLEPTCGEGSFLSALPECVPAIGVEIDPMLAERARENTGRTIHVADALEFTPECDVSHVIGNIPFSTHFLDSLLEKALDYTQDSARVGLILSAHQMQTSSRVVRWAKNYSISSFMLPRDIYKGLSKPLVFGIFTKEVQRAMIGMALFFETAELKQLPKEIQRIFNSQGRGSVWGRVIEAALIACGGTASLQQIYRYVEPRRPTNNPKWQNQIRKVVRQHFVPLGSGVYRHPHAA